MLMDLYTLFHSSLEYPTKLLHTRDSTLNVLMSKYVLRSRDNESDNRSVLVTNDDQEPRDNTYFQTGKITPQSCNYFSERNNCFHFIDICFIFTIV